MQSRPSPNTFEPESGPFLLRCTGNGPMLIEASPHRGGLEAGSPGRLAQRTLPRGTLLLRRWRDALSLTTGSPRWSSSQKPYAWSRTSSFPTLLSRYHKLHGTHVRTGMFYRLLPGMVTLPPDIRGGGGPCTLPTTRVEKRSHTAKGSQAETARMSVTLSGTTPLCPYGMAYRGAYESSTYGLFKKSR